MSIRALECGASARRLAAFPGFLACLPRELSFGDTAMCPSHRASDPAHHSFAPASLNSAQPALSGQVCARPDKENIMKTAIHTSIHHVEPIQFKLSDKARQVLIALVATLVPYAVAAIGVFAYHKQWFM
jgi:hypothetical protein